MTLKVSFPESLVDIQQDKLVVSKINRNMGRTAVGTSMWDLDLTIA